MRIIAGKFKGRTLISPKGFLVRPTSDRVKETIFNILSSRYNAFDGDALDLFCGSGALGMEAYSRGSDNVIFADKDVSSVNLTKENLKKCGMENLIQNVFLADFSLALKKLEGRKFGLILLDPPYNEGLESEIFKLIKKYGLLSRSGVIFLEHETKTFLPHDECFAVDTRACGNTSISFYSYKEIAEAD